MSFRHVALWVAVTALGASCTPSDESTSAGGPGNGTSTAGEPPAAREPPAAAERPNAAGPPASAEPSTAGWLTQTDASNGLGFRYPPDLRTRYIHPVDWPPMLQVVDGPWQCTEAGSEIARAGKTERQTLGGRSYCVTRESEGAAGSIYTMYAYAFEHGGRVAVLTFSLRAVQCGNYDEPSKSECETERAAFDVGPTIDAIARTLAP
jgi:hypothetical protein